MRTRAQQVCLWLIMVALWGLLLRGIFAPAKARASDEGMQEVIKTQRLELVDAEGKKRAEFRIDRVDGQAGLALYDTAGEIRAGLALEKDGRPVMGFFDKAGEIRAGFVLEEDERPRLALFDKTEKPRADISLKEDGQPELLLFGEDGKKVFGWP